MTEFCGQLQVLKKDGLLVSVYLLKAKTLSDHLVASSDIIFQKELVLFILNGLGPRYLTFMTDINMNQTKSSISILHGLLENYEKMLAISDKSDQDSVFQVNFLDSNKHHISGNENFGSKQFSNAF